MNLEDFNSLDMKSYYETLIEKKLSDKVNHYDAD